MAKDRNIVPKPKWGYKASRTAACSAATQQATQISAEYRGRQTMTGSGNNCFGKYCRRSKSRAGLNTTVYSCGFDGQWATTTSTVK